MRGFKMHSERETDRWSERIYIVMASPYPICISNTNAISSYNITRIIVSITHSSEYEPPTGPFILPYAGNVYSSKTACFMRTFLCSFCLFSFLFFIGAFPQSVHLWLVIVCWFLFSYLASKVLFSF